MWRGACSAPTDEATYNYFPAREHLQDHLADSILLDASQWDERSLSGASGCPALRVGMPSSELQQMRNGRAQMLHALNKSPALATWEHCAPLTTTVRPHVWPTSGYEKPPWPMGNTAAETLTSHPRATRPALRFPFRSVRGQVPKHLRRSLEGPQSNRNPSV